MNKLVARQFRPEPKANLEGMIIIFANGILTILSYLNKQQTLRIEEIRSNSYNSLH